MKSTLNAITECMIRKEDEGIDRLMETGTTRWKKGQCKKAVHQGGGDSK